MKSVTVFLVQFTKVVQEETFELQERPLSEMYQEGLDMLLENPFVLLADDDYLLKSAELRRLIEEADEQGSTYLVPAYDQLLEFFVDVELERETLVFLQADDQEFPNLQGNIDCSRDHVIEGLAKNLNHMIQFFAHNNS